MRYLILVLDPETKKWSIVMQTDNVDSALDYWSDDPKDTSQRLMIDTTQFASFKEANPGG